MSVAQVYTEGTTAEALIEARLSESEGIYNYTRQLDRIAKKYRGKWRAQAPLADEHRAEFRFTTVSGMLAFRDEATAKFPELRIDVMSRPAIDATVTLRSL